MCMAIRPPLMDWSNYISFSAPMKALAAEITRKMGKRLAWLGIKVRELTGMSTLRCRHLSTDAMP